MSDATDMNESAGDQPPVARWTAVIGSAARGAGPRLLFGLRLWAAVILALYIAFWLELDNAYWAATSAALVSQPHLGASMRKGWYRMIGTVIGAVVIVLMTAAFPQDRFGELLRIVHQMKVDGLDEIFDPFRRRAGGKTRLRPPRSEVKIRTDPK